MHQAKASMPWHGITPKPCGNFEHSVLHTVRTQGGAFCRLYPASCYCCLSRSFHLSSKALTFRAMTSTWTYQKDHALSETAFERACDNNLQQCLTVLIPPGFSGSATKLLHKGQLTWAWHQWLKPCTKGCTTLVRLCLSWPAYNLSTAVRHTK